MWLKRFSIFSLVLLVACCSLWAFPGRATGSLEAKVTDTEAVGLLPEEQRTPSGTTSKEDSMESSQTLEEALQKANEGNKISGEESSALLDELLAIQADARALREVSQEKDEVINGLTADNVALTSKLEKAEKEVGSKTYLMLEGIVGVEDLEPHYGVGLTVGARIGNSLMMQLGVDYMANSMMDFGLDKWTFRAGVGWMF